MLLLYITVVGIALYTWCLGTHAGYCDVLNNTDTTANTVEITIDTLLDGHHYFFTVLVSLL